MIIVSRISRLFTYWRFTMETHEYNDFSGKKKSKAFLRVFPLLFGPVSSLRFESTYFPEFLYRTDTNLEDERWSDFEDLSARANSEHTTNPSPDGHDIIVFGPNNDQISPLILITFAPRPYIVWAYGFYEPNVLILLYGIRKKSITLHIINNVSHAFGRGREKRTLHYGLAKKNYSASDRTRSSTWITLFTGQNICHECISIIRYRWI